MPGVVFCGVTVKGAPLSPACCPIPGLLSPTPALTTALCPSPTALQYQFCLQAPPVFTEQPQEEYFQEVGRELLVPCSAQGDPPPAVTWAKVRPHLPLHPYPHFMGGLGVSRGAGQTPQTLQADWCLLR